MVESDDGRWDPPRDDVEQDEDDEDNDDDDGDDDRVIVGTTRFTRDDFVNARRSLLGGRAPLLLVVSIPFAFVLFSFLMNYDGNGSTSLIITPMVFVAVFVFVMWNGTRRWADNVFTELHGGHDVTFRFDRHGLAVETSKRQVKVAWEVLHRALDAQLAFLIYTSANTVEVVPKRAFASDDLETLGRWLRGRIRARRQPRTFRNAILLWIVLIFAFLLIWQFLDGGRTSH